MTPRRTVTLTLLLGLAAVGAPPARATHFGDVIVVPASGEGGTAATATTTHGYVEYRFSVTNRSMATAHQVTLALPLQSQSMGSQLRQITRSVVVGPSSTV